MRSIISYYRTEWWFVAVFAACSAAGLYLNIGA
jgi:hypothetical protein